MGNNLSRGEDNSTSQENVKKAVVRSTFFPGVTLHLERGRLAGCSLCRGADWLWSTFLRKHFLGSGISSGTCPSVCVILAFKNSSKLSESNTLILAWNNSLRVANLCVRMGQLESTPGFPLVNERIELGTDPWGTPFLSLFVFTASAHVSERDFSLSSNPSQQQNVFFSRKQTQLLVNRIDLPVYVKGPVCTGNPWSSFG